jgi:hypothetical protein
MDYYSKTTPQLIDPKINKKIDKIIKLTEIKGSYYNTVISTLKPIYEYLSQIFKDNMLLCSSILIILIFLLYRYFTKDHAQDETKNKSTESFVPMIKKFYDIRDSCDIDTKKTNDLIAELENSKKITFWNDDQNNKNNNMIDKEEQKENYIIPPFIEN